MPDYANGKIYKLVNDELNLTYYGSTTSQLYKRLFNHKHQAKNKRFTSWKLFESGKVEIVLVEECPCENKEQLNRRERFYIENNECVNKLIPTRTAKEYKEKYYKDNLEYFKEMNKKYRETHKDELVKSKKEFYEVNKEKILEQKKQYYQANKELIKQKRKQYYQLNKNKNNVDI